MAAAQPRSQTTKVLFPALFSDAFGLGCFLRQSDMCILGWPIPSPSAVTPHAPPQPQQLAVGLAGGVFSHCRDFCTVTKGRERNSERENEEGKLYFQWEELSVFIFVSISPYRTHRQGWPLPLVLAGSTVNPGELRSSPGPGAIRL